MRSVVRSTLYIDEAPFQTQTINYTYAIVCISYIGMDAEKLKAYSHCLKEIAILQHYRVAQIHCEFTK